MLKRPILLLFGYLKFELRFARHHDRKLERSEKFWIKCVLFNVLLVFAVVDPQLTDL